MGRGAGELEEVVLIKVDGTLILQDGGLQDRLGRGGEGLFRFRHDAGKFGHAGDAVGNVGLRRERAMGQRQIGAVADVFAIGAGVFFKRMELFGLPDLGFEVVLENFKINLAIARQFGVIHLAGQGGQGVLGEGEPASAGGGRNVIQPVIPAMIALTGRIHGL